MNKKTKNLLTEIANLLKSRDNLTEASGKEFKAKVMTLTPEHVVLCDALCEMIIEFDNERDKANKYILRLQNRTKNINRAEAH